MQFVPPDSATKQSATKTGPCDGHHDQAALPEGAKRVDVDEDLDLLGPVGDQPAEGTEKELR
jgi:hypothetical protein